MGASRTAAILASLVGQLYVTRALGPGANGVLASAGTIVAVAMLVADLGLNASASRAMARAFYQDRGLTLRILRVSLAWKLGLTAAVAAAMAVFAEPIAGLLGEGAALAALAPVIAIAAAQLALDNLATFSFRGLQGLHDARRLAIAQAISGVSSPLLAMACVFAGTGAAGAVGGRALGALFAAIYGLAALVHLSREISREAGSSATAPSEAALAARATLAQDLATTASRILWVQLAYLLVFRVDQGLVQAFLGTEALGCYQPASAIIEKCLLPAQSIAAVAAPRFAAIDDAARRPALAAMHATTTRAVTSLYVPAAIGLALLAPDVVAVVFGPAYAATGPVLRAFALALMVLGHTTSQGVVLEYMGAGRARAVAFALMAVCDVALNALLLPRLGPSGAVLALTLAATPLAIFYSWRIARAVGAGLRPMAIDLGRALLAALVMALVVEAARWALAPLGAPRLLLVISLGGAAYAAALTALGGGDEVRALIEKVLRRIGRGRARRHG